MPSEYAGGAQRVHCADTKVTATTELARYPNPNINSDDPFEVALAIRRIAYEYGTSTGRPRRVGMLDLVMLRHTARQNGPLVAFTLVDVLDIAKEIKICVGYRYTGAPYQMGDRRLVEGDEIYDMAPDSYVMAHVEPIIETLEGWQSPIGSIREFHKLPQKLRRILARIEVLAGVKVVIVSVGPEADQTIVRL